MSSTSRGTSTDHSLVSAPKPAAAARKGEAVLLAEVVVPTLFATAPHADVVVSAEHRESLTEQRLEHIPGELGVDVRPFRDIVEVHGAMDKHTVRQTESKINHPLGKSRNGVAQRRGK